ncbi:MAG: hypothetical protein KJ970_13145 [Candidatus Eisenbacteria bacterium]|uniref:Uncharacterized protein n=1 Tax=Eiseniibacteriota bacterium TaxID=2212470 RepID=A0A948RVY2_UNCEI|nr:hypothetical protein [Candidatus Eisenbacteria bacterium]MBU1949182.1 hypothetical protein [Candidatus Eisenbacteria bacterium]MBU2691860.1 hypothetical protein [Candidatus Eisenbacteria bacterium]
MPLGNATEIGALGLGGLFALKILELVFGFVKGYKPKSLNGNEGSSNQKCDEVVGLVRSIKESRVAESERAKSFRETVLRDHRDMFQLLRESNDKQIAAMRALPAEFAKEIKKANGGS